MKNFRLVPTTVDHVDTHTIESVPDGVEVSGSREYCRSLMSKGYARLTVNTYVAALARYLDFIVEYVICSVLLGLKADGISYEDLVRVFFESLTVGCYSDDPVASRVCENLSRKVVKRRTVNIYRSALKSAFQVADKFLSNSCEAHGAANGTGFEYIRKSEIGWAEMQRVNKSSFLAGCISGGIKTTLVNLLPKYYRGSARHRIGELRVSFDKLVEVLPKIKNVRDRCLFVLLAAGGERVSEALQTLSIDIDSEQGIVRAIDPSNRPAAYYEMGLSPSDVKSLRWKGRKSDAVFLAPPFDKMFWDCYAELLVSDKYPLFDAHGRWVTHKFVFRVTKGKSLGMPLALASEGLIRKTFKRLLEKHGIVDVSPHDIRHCYVTYLSQEIPVGNARGLGLETVSELVSHVNIESTMVYEHVNRVAILNDIEKGYAEIGYHPEMLKS